jgi:hypothetical protein
VLQPRKSGENFEEGKYISVALTVLLLVLATTLMLSDSLWTEIYFGGWAELDEELSADCESICPLRNSWDLRERVELIHVCTCVDELVSATTFAKSLIDAQLNFRD